MNMEPRKQASADGANAARKAAIIDALARFMNQRSGIEFGNYGDVKAFRAEQRSIYTDLKHARVLLAAVKWRDGIDADALLKASEGAFSGRLSIKLHWDAGINGGPDSLRKAVVSYVTGQYFPTEYRRAVCAVLASALWDYTRERCSPIGTERQSYTRPPDVLDQPQSTEEQWKLGAKWMSPGDWLRAHFRKEFGRGIASRWFS